MGQLSEIIKEVYKLLYKAGYYLSLVWFLLPIVSIYCFRGIWLNMDDSPAKTDFFLAIYLWAFLLLIIAALFLLIRRKAVQLCIAAFGMVIQFLATAFLGLALQSAPTGFAEEHPIPEGLMYHTPKDEGTDMEEEVDSTDSTTWLQIRNAFQGGIYEYSFFYPQLPEGTIFLRCYEVTENLPLSEKSIKKATTQKTEGSDKFTCHVNSKRFTIYEGDWGEYYAARIEVWFKDSNGKERKLMEKVYSVEGWMR